MERNILYFFSTVTAPKLSGCFSPDFWEKRVPQASLVAPSIRHAMIAIGAVHQDFIARHENAGNCFDVSLKAFAIRHYTKAISYLHQLVSNRTQQLDITLISCILFIVFDCLIGHHTSALIHLKAGLKILEDIKQQNVQDGPSAQSTSSHEWEREFTPILLGLGVQAASFINPRDRKDRASLWESLKAVRIPTHPLTFHSLDEARHALESIAVDIMGDRIAADLVPTQLPNESPNSLTHLNALKNWTKSLDRYLVNYATRDPSVNKVRCGANMLKVHSLMMTITVTPSSANSNFERILSLCECLVAANTNCGRTAPTPSFTADFGIISPLFFAALRAPRIELMQRAYDLLSRAPGREGMWDSDDALLSAGDAIMSASQYASYAPMPSLPPAFPQKEELVWDDIQERLHAEPFAQSPEPDLSLFESLEESAQYMHPLHSSDFDNSSVDRQFSVDSIASCGSGSVSGSEFDSDASFDPPFSLEDFGAEYPLLLD
jgi:hypothetical protein